MIKGSRRFVLLCCKNICYLVFLILKLHWHSVQPRGLDVTLGKSDLTIIIQLSYSKMMLRLGFVCRNCSA